MEKRELKALIAETVREVLYEILKPDASNEQFNAERLRRAIIIRAKKTDLDTLTVSTPLTTMEPQIAAQETLLLALWNDECEYDSNQIQKISDKLDKILAKLP